MRVTKVRLICQRGVAGSDKADRGRRTNNALIAPGTMREMIDED